MLEVNKIYNMDCIEGMKLMYNFETQLAFADPPYNVGKDYGNGFNDLKYKPSYLEWCKEWFKELKRVAGTILITPGIINYLDWIIYIERPREIYCQYKPNPTTHDTFGGFIRWEPILVYGDRPRHQPSGNGCIIPVTNQRHIDNFPNPKQVKLLEKLIKDFSEPGDLVLDPFMGSGTTAVAAKKLGRNFIGFEINPEWIRLAEKRLIHTHPLKKLRDIYGDVKNATPSNH
jgi:site-specific DNA-methyltransferase (adenine-specific)